MVKPVTMPELATHDPIDQESISKPLTRKRNRPLWHYVPRAGAVLAAAALWHAIGSMPTSLARMPGMGDDRALKLHTAREKRLEENLSISEAKVVSLTTKNKSLEGELHTARSNESKLAPRKARARGRVTLTPEVATAIATVVEQANSKEPK
jgi:hypothetical protein